MGVSLRTGQFGSYYGNDFNSSNWLTRIKITLVNFFYYYTNIFIFYKYFFIIYYKNWNISIEYSQDS